jgi:predicted methyltransferase
MYRVLKNGGQLFLVTPLNFQKTVHWQQLYPIDKVMVQLSKIGYVVVAVEEDIIINEPLDVHGNLISWKCLGVVCSR